MTETIEETDPTTFLKEGDRVRAKMQILDLPDTPTPGPVHAESGEEGVVVHTDPGFWPTVRFDKTDTMTCVTDKEVEKING